MGDPIAERELTIRRPTGGAQKVLVRMWPPERDEHGGYDCRVEIDVPGEEPIRLSGFGADAFQAITLTMSRIPMRLLPLEISGDLTSDGLYDHWFPEALVRPLGAAPLGAGSKRKPIEVADTWVERVLDFAPNDGGERRRLFVKLGRPYTQPGMGGSWSVEIEIQEGMKSPLRSHATGEDSFEAMERATRQIAILLEGWQERGKITWDGEPGSGFANAERDPRVAGAADNAWKGP